MPGLITGDNLIAFEIAEAPPSNGTDDGPQGTTKGRPRDDQGDDFHLLVYTLGDNPKDPWVLRARIGADQLTGALHRSGLLPPQR